MRKGVVYAVIFFLAFLLFSYRLTQVPSGLTIDESAFGYNAVLLSKTLRDENNRLLPMFVLSLEGRDWRQPVTQYFMTGFFKLFGPSVYNLRLTSVITASLGAVLIYLLGKWLLGRVGAVFSLLFFITTPIIMIHSHLGLDNITPVPFVLLWLIFLYLFEKKKNNSTLLLSAVFLGIGFYSYKGMRSFVPVWSVLTAIYLLVLAYRNKEKVTLIKKAKPLAVFVLSLLPFYAIIPFLEFKYAGAVLSGASISNVESIYTFTKSYLASFDPSFLFVTGDILPHHTTGVHGMLLLASLPLFLLGLCESLRKNRFWKFLVIAFFVGPLLFGVPGSVHRASRLIAIVPFYALISAHGAVRLWKATIKQKFVLLVLLSLVFINYFDFLKYYWYQYPKETHHIFYRSTTGEAYKYLSEEAEKRNLTPHVSYDFIKNEGITDMFFRSIYFLYPSVWNREVEKLPQNAILMTNNAGHEGMEKLEYKNSNIFVIFHKRE